MAQKPNMFVSFIDSVSSLFLTGLFCILPVTLTIAVFTISFRVIVNWLEPLRRLDIPFLNAIPYSEVILALTLIFAAGMLYNMFLLRPIIHAIENLFSRIPLIRPVYSGIKKLVDAFSFQDKVSFSKVVRVEFPRPGIYSIGFLANQVDEKIAPDMNAKYFSILFQQHQIQPVVF